jgi:hypothetical protein
VRVGWSVGRRGSGVHAGPKRVWQQRRADVQPWRGFPWRELRAAFRDQPDPVGARHRTAAQAGGRQ